MPWIAAVRGARIAVVTCQHSHSRAITCDARVHLCAWVAVVAFVLAGVEETVAVCTGLFRAWVAVVAGKWCACGTGAVDACVVFRARISVAANVGDHRMRTSPISETAIVCARIVIIACQTTFPRTSTLGAVVAHRARVGVVAGVLIGSEDTSNRRITIVVGACISVLTGQHDVARGAFTAAAGIA